MASLLTKDLEDLSTDLKGTDYELRINKIRATDLIQSGEFNKAKEILEALPDTMLSSQSVIVQLIGCYLNLQDYQKAKDYLVQALVSDPESPELTTYLGYSLHKLGNLEQAIDKYKAVIARSGDYIFAYQCLAKVFCDIKDYPEALSVIEIGLSKSEYNDPALWYLKGVVLSTDPTTREDACLALATAISLDELNYNAWFDLAVVLNSLERVDEANLALSRIPTSILEALAAEAKSLNKVEQPHV